MTDCSLNEQFEDLVQKTLQEQKQVNDNSNQEMKQNNKNNNNNNVSAKSLDFIQDNNVIKKKKNAFKTVYNI